MPIIFDYKNVDEVNWSDDGKFIAFSTSDKSKKQFWQYDLQLESSNFISEQPLLSKSNDTDTMTKQSLVARKQVLSIEEMKQLNPSYQNYITEIELFLTAYANEQLPVDSLAPSLLLYRPHVFELGIYYVVKQGHQLALYLYKFAEQAHMHIANLGQHEQAINLMLNISASDDGKQIVFSKVESFETDILLQRKVQ